MSRNKARSVQRHFFIFNCCRRQKERRVEEVVKRNERKLYEKNRNGSCALNARIQSENKTK